ncbi:MAG: ComF family protein [Erysipelotrichia bacterium]|nr:ComF family protein [Erysipelotrichia bacterium]NCC54385.1 ComF family protein [Erysipelotrichia bacterium]
MEYFQKEDIICGECKRKLHVLNRWYEWENHKIKALYLYNDFMESLLFQFKEGRDVALKKVFFKAFIKEIFDNFKDYTIVYMPSSKKKCEERGFFPLALMLEELSLTKLTVFKKNKEMKQSMQSYENRKNIAKVIDFEDNVSIPQSKLLLVDDVCTSGNTLKCAFNLLKEHTYEVEALVLSIHPRFVESCD